MAKTFKAYPVTDGFYLVIYKHPVPKPHVRHFIDGYKGVPFSGRSTTTVKQPGGSYQTESDSLFYYRRGENARLSVDKGEQKLTAADYVASNADSYDIIDPDAPKKARQPLTAEQRQQKDAAKAAAGIYHDLPRIVAVLGVTDHGPCDAGTSAICPHCGAEGRYVYSFKCDDGSTRGAMRGCITKFPRHPFANESQRILDKESDYKKRGWQLPSWDITIRDAIFSFADGEITEDEAQRLVQNAQTSRHNYNQRRKSRR